MVEKASKQRVRKEHIRGTREDNSSADAVKRDRRREKVKPVIQEPYEHPYRIFGDDIEAELNDMGWM